jgi:hypothetical protein
MHVAVIREACKFGSSLIAIAAEDTSGDLRRNWFFKK